jgi:hypothetical protein
MRARFGAVLAACLALGCDAGLRPSYPAGYCASGICGTVRFSGVLPDSTDYVRVVAYANVPTTIAELTGFAGFSDPLPLHADSAHYTCCITPLPAGTYRWVLVVWKKIGPLSPTNATDLLREAGSYLDPADTTRFGVVAVPASGGVSGVDIVADYGHLHSISDYFPPAAAARRR